MIATQTKPKTLAPSASFEELRITAQALDESDQDEHLIPRANTGASPPRATLSANPKAIRAAAKAVVDNSAEDEEVLLERATDAFD